MSKISKSLSKSPRIQIKFLSDMINKELSFLLPRMLVFDLIIYFVTLPFYKFGVSMPLGLLLGNLAVLVNFVLLGLSSERAVQRISHKAKSAKQYMFRWYVLRMLIMAAFVYGAIKIPYISLLGAALPLFFPKLAYTIQAFYINFKENKKNK